MDHPSEREIHGLNRSELGLSASENERDLWLEQIGETAGIQTGEDMPRFIMLEHVGFITRLIIGCCRRLPLMFDPSAWSTPGDRPIRCFYGVRMSWSC